MTIFQSCGHCWVFQIFWHIECSTFTASSFRIWNNLTGIPSPQPALLVVMLPKAHLTLHSKMSGSRWVITPLWLSGSWRCFSSTRVLKILILMALGWPKSSFGFLQHLTEKPKWTFWPNRYLPVFSCFEGGTAPGDSSSFFLFFLLLLFQMPLLAFKVSWLTVFVLHGNLTYRPMNYLILFKSSQIGF